MHQPCRNETVYYDNVANIIDMMSCVLYHLGDLCAPGFIINTILGERHKKLFMLGEFRFNDIISYLNDNDLESIYDKEFLEPLASNTS